MIKINTMSPWIGEVTIPRITKNPLMVQKIMGFTVQVLSIVSLGIALLRRTNTPRAAKKKKIYSEIPCTIVIELAHK